MRRRARPLLAAIALGLALALGLAACGGASTTIERTVTVMKSHPAPRTLLPDVLGNARVKPKTYSFSVDGDLVMVNLRWRHWGGGTATATGRIEERPASGLVDRFAGSMRASKPVRCHGARYYTEVFAEVPPQAPFVPAEPTALETPCG